MYSLIHLLYLLINGILVIAIVPPMHYTFGSVPGYAIPENGVQIFTLKIAQLKEEEGLYWPLHVYGSIAVRDSIDPRRNFIFHRTRDDCQILTQEGQAIDLSNFIYIFFTVLHFLDSSMCALLYAFIPTYNG